MRYPSLEFGAGEVCDYDIDERNDIRPLSNIHHVGHALSVPLLEGHYAIIHSSQFIEHLAPDEQIQFVERCFRLLIPGGLIVTFTPDLDWIHAAHATGDISDDHYHNLLGGKQDYPENTHKGLLTQTTIRALFEGAGFEIHELHTADGSLAAIAFKPGEK